MSLFRRTRSEALVDQANASQAVSKHRKKVTVSQAKRGNPAERRELFNVNMTVTKTPPWLARRRNRAANRVARRARRVNQLRRRGR